MPHVYINKKLTLTFTYHLFVFGRWRESDGVDCMFPLILVLLKILYSRISMLKGLPPVSN